MVKGHSLYPGCLGVPSREHLMQSLRGAPPTIAAETKFRGVNQSPHSVSLNGIMRSAEVAGGAFSPCVRLTAAKHR